MRCQRRENRNGHGHPGNDGSLTDESDVSRISWQWHVGTSLFVILDKEINVDRLVKYARQQCWEANSCTIVSLS